MILPNWPLPKENLAVTLFLTLLLIAGPAAHHAAAAEKNDRDGTPPQFVGSQSCKTCHAAEHAAWTSSQHSQAMQVAVKETVLGRFDGTTFTKDGVESTFFQKDGKFWVRTDGPDGVLADFEVLYTFGVSPLQQYLIALPGGRLQALGIAWDSRQPQEGGQRWFSLYPDRKLQAGDPLHWTGIDQNWNYQCAWCHSTDLKKDYDRASRTFATKWSEINIGCEACHGPASGHVAWAAKPSGPQTTGPESKGFDVGFGISRSATWTLGPDGKAQRSHQASSNKEILVCASCHSRREQFSDHPVAVARYFDAFRASRLEPGLYFADGQQRDEVYTYASFLQSRMYAAGVTCSDCHNPHTGKLRQSGNAVCSQCHATERFDTPKHHHHSAGSAGSQCTSCHMPTTVYMGVDPRHDHSMRIPRPDITQVVGAPNACDRCHAGKPAQAFELGDSGAPGTQAALIQVAEDTSLSGIVRASAIARLGRYPSRNVMAAVARAAAVDDPDIRTAAIAALTVVGARARVPLLAPLLRDQSRIVRMDAARGIAGSGEQSLAVEDRQLFERALSEYVDAQLFNAERPEAQSNLGALYMERGMIEEARAAFKEALQLDRTFVPAAISWAELERNGGSETTAEALLRRSLEANPKSGPLHHALGLSLVRQKRMTEALEVLARAAEFAPDNPQFSYVFAVAEHGAGRRAEAIKILKAALVRHPYDRDILMALISYQLEARDTASALANAELMIKLEPSRTDVRHLVARLRGQLR